MNSRRLLFLFGLFAAAVITRIYLASFPGFEGDIEAFGAWAERLADVGPVDAYSDASFTLVHGLPPGYLYILWGIGLLQEAFFADLAPNEGLYSFALRMPANTFDILTAIIIFKILEKRSYHLGLIGVAFYLFNPAIFYNSAVWGQNEAVFTFFMLLAVYLVLEERPELASLSMAGAILIEALAIAFVPVFAVVVLLRTPPKRVALSAAVGVAALFLLSLPFFWDDPVFGLPDFVDGRRTASTHASLNAFNLWWIIRGEGSDLTPFALSLSAETWGILLWFAAQLVIAIWLYKRRKDEGSVYWAVSLAWFSFFILTTRQHERYLFPFFSFFLVAALLSRYRIALTAAYGFLSVLHFLNLYFAMGRYYGHLTLEPFYSWSSNDLLISYLLVGSFFALLTASLFLLIPLATIKRRFSIGFG